MNPMHVSRTTTRTCRLPCPHLSRLLTETTCRSLPARRRPIVTHETMSEGFKGGRSRCASGITPPPAAASCSYDPIRLPYTAGDRRSQYHPTTSSPDCAPNTSPRSLRPLPRKPPLPPATSRSPTYPSRAYAFTCHPRRRLRSLARHPATLVGVQALQNLGKEEGKTQIPLT